MNSYTKVVLLCILSFCFSCCTVYKASQEDLYKQEEQMLEKAKLSVIKISGMYFIGVKDKEDKADKIKEENKAIAMFNGSGSIIKQTPNNTLILTAAHVCDPVNEERVKFHFPFYDNEKYRVLQITKFLINDVYGNNHIGIVLALNKLDDTCILITDKIDLPALPLATYNVRTSQRVYSINYPKGLFELGYNPVFTGFFVGEIMKNRNSDCFGFSLQTIGGSSGGVIFDVNGNVISMVHSYFTEFNQLSLGATTIQIKNILDGSLYILDKNKEIINKKLLLENKLYKETIQEP